MTSTITSAPACPAPRHDTRWAYEHHGCRCPRALAANADKAARRRATLRRDVTPTSHYDVDLDRVDAVTRGGVPTPLGVAERRLAATRMAWAGESALAMAYLTGVTERTIWRTLAHLRDAGLVL